MKKLDEIIAMTVVQEEKEFTGAVDKLNWLSDNGYSPCIFCNGSSWICVVNDFPQAKGKWKQRSSYRGKTIDEAIEKAWGLAQEQDRISRIRERLDGF